MVEPLEGRALLAVVAWDGGGSGADWNDAANWKGDALPGMADDIVIDLPAGAATHITADLAVRSIQTNATIELRGGTLSVSGIVRLSGAFIQSAGTTHLQGGTLEAAGGVRIAGGNLAGSGTIKGDTILDGTLSPGASPGAITFGGDLVLGSTAQVVVELAGTSAGAFDTIAVGGQLTLGGRLTVALIDGFAGSIAYDDSFAFLTAGSIAGTFANVAADARLRVSGAPGTMLLTQNTASATVQGFFAGVAWMPSTGGEWATASNWSSAPALPNPADSVLIDVGGAAGVTVADAGSQSLASLDLGGQNRLDLGSGANILRLGALRMSATAKLDLADGMLIVQSNAANREDVLDDIEALVGSARNSAGTLWAGNGITTSAATANTTLGVILNDDGTGQPVLPKPGGVLTDINSILVKYGYYGDTDLNGQVDGRDYLRMDSGFLTSARGYRNGDLNLRGSIDGDDYFLIDLAFLTQDAVLASGEPPAESAVLSAAATPAAGRAERQRPGRGMTSLKFILVPFGSSGIRVAWSSVAQLTAHADEEPGSSVAGGPSGLHERREKTCDKDTLF